MMALEEYQKKRKFDKTPEPKGKIKKAPLRQGYAGQGRFSVQEHDASHLHYDLRLEIEGVLKSWAIPKEPPKEAGIRRLAVRTEDHPVEYANFEGIIPKGEYGAGLVEIWDKGTYSILDEKEDKLTLQIEGEKLKGIYVLVRLRDKRNWLLFKKTNLKSH